MGKQLADKWKAALVETSAKENQVDRECKMVYIVLSIALSIL